jgi:outer membrane receptor protein involved in Fe transport
MQITRDRPVGSFGNLLSFGVEWLDGSTDASGLYTAPAYAEPSSNTGDNTTVGLFVQDTFRFAPRWSLLAAVRFDKQQVSYDETLPSTIVDSKSYAETSLRGGVNFNPTEHHGLYASYGEAFLPPTVEQLFAYPAFGSNPDLVPEVSRNLELGYRGRWGAGLWLDAAAFVLDTDDEIVFVVDPALGGQNRNIGQTRRTGVEAAVRSRVGSGIELFVNLTLTDSEFRNGPNEGDEVPLVPRRRLSAGLEAELPVGFLLRADGLFVGDQVLDNDDANEGPLLPDYTVINLRLLWSAAALAGPASSRAITLFLEARNVFDLRYATRGIYVFDFTQSENVVYVTPAPERRWLGGIEWTF